MNGPQCSGDCLTGSDIGIPSGAIAYPHPDCPLHGDAWIPKDNEWSRQYIADHPERFPQTDDGAGAPGRDNDEGAATPAPAPEATTSPAPSSQLPGGAS